MRSTIFGFIFERKGGGGVQVLIEIRVINPLGNFVDDANWLEI